MIRSRRWFRLRSLLPYPFLIVGGGKRFAWLEEAKKREGLENIVLHGYVQKELTPGVMAAAALVALLGLRRGVQEELVTAEAAA